eukprot:2986337-Amphidinium_carterae.2
MRELAERETRLTQMSTPTTMATPDPRSEAEVESPAEQHDQQLRTTVEQWTNRTSQLTEMMTCVEQQEQAYMNLEVRMSNERDSWMSEALTLKEQMTSRPQTSQPTPAPPSRVVPPPPRPPQVSGAHPPPTAYSSTSESQGRVAPIPGTGYGTDPPCTPAVCTPPLPHTLPSQQLPQQQPTREFDPWVQYLQRTGACSSTPSAPPGLSAVSNVTQMTNMTGVSGVPSVAACPASP